MSELSDAQIDVAALMAGVFEPRGDADALIHSERDRRYSFAELDLLSNRIANFLDQRLGLGRDDRYLLILDNDNLSLMHVWTFLKAASTPVFCNFRDTPDEHLRIVDYVAPRAVFIEAAMLPRYSDALRARDVAVIVFDHPGDAANGVIGFWPEVQAMPATPTRRTIAARGEAVFCRFTGGTTGVPKCAMYDWANLAFTWEGMAALSSPPFDSATRAIHVTPLSHGTMMVLLPTFMAGGCNITQNSADLTLWLANVEKYRATLSFLVPTLLYRLAEMQAAQPRDLGSLRTLIYGAAPMAAAKLADLHRAFGQILVQFYAATEAIGPGLWLPREWHRADTERDRERLSSAGLVCPGVEIRLVGDDGRDVATGEVGELWIRHPGVISGYYANPDASAAEIIDGWWKSGDLCRMDHEGFVYLVDRKKDMIITGGFNVYAVEVEAALLKQADVVMAAVVGLPDAEWGEAIHAEIVARPGSTIDHAALLRAVSNDIGPYKAPKSLKIVDQLPLSPVGKVLRREVRARYRSEMAPGSN
ncbi:MULTISPECIES: class I adenylate-forming enzyme family protein [unclassified Sphingomonas]|uniref:class I adenylate-forming enzyme family protein n=1 Tax=unclassified Sphingomonas TaxID=196159 RepID=UPI000831FAA0|nr:MULTISPECIES: AMP-binding protein [unclassified Sphingomonas]